MKSLKNYLYLLICVLFIPQYVVAQDKEVPVTTSSKEALDLFMSGRDKFENLNFVPAATFFDQAIQKDPSFALAYLYRSESGGSSNVFRQNLEKAVSLAGNVSEGERLEILYAQAISDRNGTKQKEYLDKLLSSFPSDKRVRELAGEYYYSINDFKNALDHFTKASELDKNYPPVYNMIGYTQSAQNNFPEAEKAFQTYMRLVPDNPNPYDSYAELLLKLGKYDESIAQYKKALEKDPQFTSSIAGLGNNYVFKGDFTAARKNYQDYFDESTTVSGKLDALFLKAVTYIHEGKSADAVKAFDEYRSLAEKENQTTSLINAYDFEGFTVSESGNPAEGLKYFEKADELIANAKVPESTKENLKTNSMLWHFYYLTASNDLDKATAESEKCRTRIESRKDPQEQMFFNTLMGIFEFRKGDFDKALKYLSEADTQDPWTWYYTALAYSKKGDKDSSAKLYDKITKWNVNSLNLAFVRKPAMEELRNYGSAK